MSVDRTIGPTLVLLFRETYLKAIAMNIIGTSLTFLFLIHSPVCSLKMSEQLLVSFGGKYVLSKLILFFKHDLTLDWKIVNIRHKLLKIVFILRIVVKYARYPNEDKSLHF